MIETVYLSGKFVNKETGGPYEGRVQLFPSRLWVDEDGVSYATRGADVMTKSGFFKVALTSCKKRDGDFGWHYTIKCPLGVWTIKPEAGEGEVLHLKDLLNTRFTQ